MKQNKTLLVLLLVAVIGVVGLTVAYFSSTATFENEFQTSEYGATYIEKFVSPDNWLPGDEVEKPEPPVPGSEYLALNATNAAGAEYNATTKGNMFTFSHTVNGNTVNETRYIGDAPKNYVKFNCDDDGTNCETWRILGVFDVDDGTGNVEQRMKLVRGSAFATNMMWDDNIDGSYKNDWTDANASFAKIPFN